MRNKNSQHWQRNEFCVTPNNFVKAKRLSFAAETVFTRKKSNILYNLQKVFCKKKSIIRNKQKSFALKIVHLRQQRYNNFFWGFFISSELFHTFIVPHNTYFKLFPYFQKSSIRVSRTFHDSGLSFMIMKYSLRFAKHKIAHRGKLQLNITQILFCIVFESA